MCARLQACAGHRGGADGAQSAWHHGIQGVAWTRRSPLLLFREARGPRALPAPPIQKPAARAPSDPRPRRPPNPFSMAAGASIQSTGSVSRLLAGPGPSDDAWMSSGGHRLGAPRRAWVELPMRTSPSMLGMILVVMTESTLDPSILQHGILEDDVYTLGICFNCANLASTGTRWWRSAKLFGMAGRV